MAQLLWQDRVTHLPPAVRLIKLELRRVLQGVTHCVEAVVSNVPLKPVERLTSLVYLLPDFLWRSPNRLEECYPLFLNMFLPGVSQLSWENVLSIVLLPSASLKSFFFFAFFFNKVSDFSVAKSTAAKRALSSVKSIFYFHYHWERGGAHFSSVELSTFSWPPCVFLHFLNFLDS